MIRLGVVVIIAVAIMVLSLSSPSLLPEAEASSVECWEIGPNSNTEDTPSYYRYTYYYFRQCNYYNDNNQLYQYWYTVTSIREYRSKTSSYYDRDYYYTTQTWTLVNSEYNEWVSKVKR